MPSSVKGWLEASLCSHVSLCCTCSFKYQLLSVRFSVLWRDPYYFVCAYTDGKLKQCMVSLEDLQSKKYAHCQIVSRLCGVSLITPLSDLGIGPVYIVLAQEKPAWLSYSGELYRLHLSYLPASVLALTAKSCSTDPKNMTHNKTSFISNIINHFLSECNVFLATTVRDGHVLFQDKLYVFIEHTECIYGSSIAALLREPPFFLSHHLVHRHSLLGGLQWFHESIDELVHRLHSFSTDELLCAIKKIPGHR